MKAAVKKIRTKHQDFKAMARHAEDAATLLRSMANSKRLMILCSLAGGELSVSELNDRIDLSQSALSQHLAGLREMELVQTRREGQIIYYQLADDKAVQIIQVLKSIYCPD